KAEALGCSAMMTKKYYVRNYDFSPDLYDGLFSLIQPDTSFATAGYNLQILGRHDGVNQEGLVAGLHFVSNHGYKKGLSAWTAVRIVLDSCATTSEAVNLLKEIPHAACYNFSLGDKNGDMAVVEASPDKVIVRRGVPALSCVNHFQSEQLKNKNRSSIEHSVKRHNYLEKLKDDEHSCADRSENLKSTDSAHFSYASDYHLCTRHTL